MTAASVEIAPSAWPGRPCCCQWLEAYAERRAWESSYEASISSGRPWSLVFWSARPSNRSPQRQHPGLRTYPGRVHHSSSSSTVVHVKCASEVQKGGSVLLDSSVFGESWRLSCTRRRTLYRAVLGLYLTRMPEESFNTGNKVVILACTVVE